MSAIVVASNPRSANSLIAASWIAWRVCCFLRSRKPEDIAAAIVAICAMCKPASVAILQSLWFPADNEHD
jgi:hypothetical protein